MYAYFRSTRGAGVYDQIVVIAVANKVERE